MATNPGGSKQAAACGQWLLERATGGAMVVVPEIADYEVRRELLRARRSAGIDRLDALIAEVEYLAITTSPCAKPHGSGPRRVNGAAPPQPIPPSTATSS